MAINGNITPTVSVLELVWTLPALYACWRYGQRSVRSWRLSRATRAEAEALQWRADIRLARWLALLCAFEAFAGIGLVLMMVEPGPSSDASEPSGWVITLLMLFAQFVLIVIGDWNEIRERWVARSTLRVLIVDDDANIREAVRELLVEEGYIVRTLDGPEALASIDLWAPDVALIDLMMPGVDGRAIAAKLRAVAPSARVIVFSARAAAEVEQIAADVEADGWIGKPFDIDDILAAVRGPGVEAHTRAKS